MRRVKVIHHVGKPERREALPPSWEIIEVDTPILVTYRAIAKQAMREGWDQSTVIVQDDVRFKGQIAIHSEPLVVYGQTTSPGHVCPRAFAADTPTWVDLYQAWMAGRGNGACLWWQEIVQNRGLILDTTKLVGE